METSNPKPVILVLDEDLKFTRRLKKAFNSRGLDNEVRSWAESGADILLYLHGEFETVERSVVIVSPSFTGGEATLHHIENTKPNIVKFVFGTRKEERRPETWQWAAHMGARWVYDKRRTYLPGFAALVNSREFWEEVETSAIDARTGLPTYEAFKERAVSILRAAQREAQINPKLQKRYSDDFTMLAIDVDHFGRVNNTHGHSVGNECLQAVAKVIREHIRANVDLCCRFGSASDEFFVLVQGVAEHTAAQIHESLKKSNVCDHQGIPIALSVTIGEARISRQEIHHAEESYEKLEFLADKELVAQKKARGGTGR